MQKRKAAFVAANWSVSPASATLTYTSGTPTINIVGFNPTAALLVNSGYTPGVSVVQSGGPAPGTSTALYIGGVVYGL